MTPFKNSCMQNIMAAERQSQSVTTDSQPLEPNLGVFYYVQRVDESWHVAEVIQKRENLETKEQEFYVHYKECKQNSNYVISDF